VLQAFLVSTILITLAELGDKTQLLALMLAARYRAWQVLVGITVATLLVHLLSTVVGAAIGSAIPQSVLSWVAGLAFIGFGVWTLRGDEVDEEEAAGHARFGPIVATGIAFFLAELGDKTQVMTMTMRQVRCRDACPGGSAASWLPAVGASNGSCGAGRGCGWSTLGMVLADGAAIVVGAVLGKALPERLITRVSGVLFLVGVAMIASLPVVPRELRGCCVDWPHVRILANTSAPVAAARMLRPVPAQPLDALLGRRFRHGGVRQPQHPSRRGVRAPPRHAACLCAAGGGRGRGVALRA
jgi:putative Ca2+/H+ antiporter (TMEM165/GDT1 family)